MRARVSKTGEIAVPAELRRRLGIRGGDELDVRIENGAIVLTPCSRRHAPVEIVTDPATGLPMLNASPDAPVLTSEDVRALLANFP